MPVFSIVIPVYNAAETLPATVAALKAQTITDWEAILVEDGSNDASWPVAQELSHSDARLKLVRNPGKGPSAARNHGALKLATGKIIAFCDADDIWLPTKLQDVARCLLEEGVVATFGRIGFFREDISHVRTWSRVPEDDVTVPMLMGENPVCTLSNLSLRREFFADLGGFREDMVHNEDLEFLIRLSGHGYRLKGIDADHVLYRLSPHGLSANLEAMRAGREKALSSAARFGYRPDPGAEAVHLRYLARRALRIGASAKVARALVIEGCRLDARAFLLPARRGGMIALAVAILPILPAPVRRHLFSN
ncbi:glycosyltransferase family 2 protein [Celeribacter sp. ULVN23_4]